MGVFERSDQADHTTDAGYRAIFAAFPFVKTFMQNVPVTWDDTRMLSGTPDSHVVLARQHGQTWWVAGLVGTTGPVDLDLPLDFLGAGDFTQTCIATGSAPDAMEQTQTSVTAPDSLTRTLPARDGFICVYSPS